MLTEAALNIELFTSVNVLISNTMSFECEKYLSKCNAACCYNVGIPKWKLNKYKDKIITKVIAVNKIKGAPGNVLAITNNKNLPQKCPFLKPDNTCAIYEFRMHACKMFGTENVKHNKCPVQNKEGVPRGK